MPKGKSIGHFERTAVAEMNSIVRRNREKLRAAGLLKKQVAARAQLKHRIIHNREELVDLLAQSGDEIQDVEAFDDDSLKITGLHNN